jgi:diguanylate cyclase (GGDEF)-like protein
LWTDSKRKELIWSSHIIDLVSIEAQVLSAARGATQDEYGLIADGQLFTAVFRHSSGIAGTLPPMKQIPPGARVRVTGICITADPNPYSEQVAFYFLMRSFDDIVVVGNPSPINTRNLIVLVGLLVIVVLAVSARGWLIERRMRRQTAALASLEQRRSHILEDINGNRPLSEIVAEIASLASSMLDGTPCWCQLAEGPCVGESPVDTKGLRIAREPIHARTGCSFGILFAAFDPLAKPCPGEQEALSIAAALTTLAVETRGLFSELLHRSEFDLLTGIHNRFSFDKHLDALIQESRVQARFFGLLYIDLNEFKQVNDVCGHQVGDLYLQQASERMKQQVRPQDLLARVGGDEFAILVSPVRGRTEIEEISLRIERSFDDPFLVDDYTLHGSASVGIALYPEDANTNDGLLSAADGAMYTAKKARKQIAQILAGQREPEFISRACG